MQPHEPRFGVLFEGQYARRSSQQEVVYHPVEDLRKFKAAGVTIVLMQLYEAYRGTLFYNSRKYPQFRESAERDFLQETLQAAGDLGMKVWLWSAEKGCPLSGPIYEAYKDCLEQDQFGHTLATWDHNFVGQCINSPWRDFVKDIYEEVLTSYPGIECIVVSDEVGYFDAAHWGGYCPNCIAKFKAKFGQEPPRTANWEDQDGLWWSFVKERILWWQDYVADLSALTKRIAPHVSTAVIINWFVLTTILKGVDVWEFSKLPDIDILMSDLFFRVFEQDHPTYQAWVGSLMQSLAEQSGKRLYLTDSAYRTVSPVDILPGALNAVVNTEGIFYYNLRHIADRQPNLEAVGNVSQVASVVSACLPDAQPLQPAAILLPKYLWRDHYYLDSLQLLHETTGLFQCLALSGLPAKMLLETPVADLSRFPLVVVPELFSPPAEMLDALEQYVRSGGVLVMTLQRPDGPQTESDAALWKLFSAGYLGKTPPIRTLQSNDAIPVDEQFAQPHLSLPVYDWPVVQHQLFGGFPTVTHQRPHLQPSAQSQVLLHGLDDDGQRYPLMIETSLGKGTLILSAESFGANFNAYMQKCAGHPSMWLARAMNLRDFFQNAVQKRIAPRLAATALAQGNVVTYWWQSAEGLAAWVINHEYSENQTVRLSFKSPGAKATAEVYSGRLVGQALVGQAQPGDLLTLEVEVAPASMAVVVVKHNLPPIREN